jgi:hypothetical protein
MARINVVAYVRKPFVVISSYIGPDRLKKIIKERALQKISRSMNVIRSKRRRAGIHF